MQISTERKQKKIDVAGLTNRAIKAKHNLGLFKLCNAILEVKRLLCSWGFVLPIIASLRFYLHTFRNREIRDPRLYYPQIVLPFSSNSHERSYLIIHFRNQPMIADISTKIVLIC